MFSKKPTTSIRFAGVCLALTACITISCNESSEKKDSPDTPAQKPVEQVAPPPAPIDTSKMDTASTRPVKTTD